MDIKDKSDKLEKSLYKTIKKEMNQKKPKNVIDDILDSNNEAQIDPNLVPSGKTKILNKSKKKIEKFKKSEDFARDFLNSFVGIANNFKELSKSNRFEAHQEQKAGQKTLPREKALQREVLREPPKKSAVGLVEDSDSKKETYQSLKDHTKIGFQESKDPETSYKENVNYKNQWVKDLLELNRKGVIKDIKGLDSKEIVDKKSTTKIIPMAASEKDVK